MWPNTALSDIIRGWKSLPIGREMGKYKEHLDSRGLDPRMFNLDIIADCVEHRKRNSQVKKILEAMYDTDWEDDIRAEAHLIEEQYGPELGDLSMLHNIVHFING